MVEGNYQQQAVFLPNYVFGPSVGTNPIFWNFALTPASPAVNSGNNGLVPPYVTTDLAGLPRIVNDIVDLLLAKKPEERLQSARDVINVLEEIVPP